MQGPSRFCARSGTPEPLTITNGVIKSTGGPEWEGTVNPQGGLALHSPRGSRIDAQIDAQGTIRGQMAGTSCVFTYVWRKQAG
jgi:hypothetical protein